jgi:hypothetical protein
LFHCAVRVRPDEIQPVQIVVVTVTVPITNAFHDASAENGSSAAGQSEADFCSVAKARGIAGAIATALRGNDAGPAANPGATTNGASTEINADGRSAESDTLCNAWSATTDSCACFDSAKSCSHPAANAGETDAHPGSAAGR